MLFLNIKEYLEDLCLFVKSYDYVRTSMTVEDFILEISENDVFEITRLPRGPDEIEILNNKNDYTFISSKTWPYFHLLANVIKLVLNI